MTRVVQSQLQYASLTRGLRCRKEERHLRCATVTAPDQRSQPASNTWRPTGVAAAAVRAGPRTTAASAWGKDVYRAWAFGLGVHTISGMRRAADDHLAICADGFPKLIKGLTVGVDISHRIVQVP